MNVGKALAVVATLATVWGVTYMHDRARRYDIVAAGAGSGGAQDTAGETTIHAFIIDHETGRVWVTSGIRVMGSTVIPVHCSAEEIKSAGCVESPVQDK